MRHLRHRFGRAGMPQELHCDMESHCKAPVTHIDNQGFIYCTAHGSRRKGSGTPCRKLTKAEIQTLKSGQPIRYRK